MKRNHRVLPVFLVLAVFAAPAVLFAHGSEEAHKSTLPAEKELKTFEDLKAEVKALRKTVEELEALKPSLTTIMPNFAERFHVMHFAGYAGDWVVAQHELLELKSWASVAKIIDPDKGNLMKGFLTKPFNDLGEAIEHGDRTAFEKALKETVKNCNACHVAVGSSFIEVTLDVDQVLSMRHSHKFEQHRAAHEMGTHTH